MIGQKLGQMLEKSFNILGVIISIGFLWTQKVDVTSISNIGHVHVWAIFSNGHS